MEGWAIKNNRIKHIIKSLVTILLIVALNSCSKLSTQGRMNEASVAPETNSQVAQLSDLQRGQLLYANNCARCHGSVESSAKLNRTQQMISTATQTIPEMSALRILSAAEVALISYALNPAAVPTTTQAGRQVFVCDSSQLAPTPILKLTNREFRLALNSLVDDFSASATSSLSADVQLAGFIGAIPSDNLAANRFANKEQNFLLTQQMQDAVFNSAFRAGQLVATASTGLGNFANTNRCLAVATVTQACHQLFVRELASRAFRRPVTTLEGNSLAAALWDSALGKSDLITLTFAGLVQMPDFMYRVYDQGQISARGARVLNLTAHEVASKLSFMLVGQPPDATLKSLADSGQILNSSILNQQVDRLFATPQAQEMITRLFKESYGYDKFDAFNYSQAFLNGISTSNLTAAMTGELDQFFNQVVLTQSGSFRDLMSSQSANVSHAGLGQIYGVVANGVQTLPAARAGFINRAAFLAKKSGNYTTPVKRGLAVLENVLCENVGNPPPNAPTSVTETQIMGQYQTTRQRYAALSEQPGTTCLQCHSRINSIGYAFENFDSIGRARTMESIFTSATSAPVTSLSVNSESQILDLKSSPTFVRHSVDLAQELSTNDKAMMCFVKHLKSFESRRPAMASDGCQNNRALNILYGSNGQQGSVKEAIKAIILAEEFKLWSY